MFNPNRINIHELTIEQPEKPSELPFDPERDITEEDWQKMENFLKHYKEGYNERDMSGNKYRIYGRDFSDQAMEMKILDPTKNLDLDQAARECMEGELKELKHNNDWSGFSRQAMQMKFIDPTQNLGLNLTAWKRMKKNISESKRDADSDGGGYQYKWDRFFYDAVCIKILDSHQELEIDQAAWKKLKDSLEYYREGNYWDAFAHQAMMIKILDPEYDLKLDQAAWQGMKDKLEKFRRAHGTEDWKKLISQATEMTILVAEEVKVTDKGLEINMRKNKPLTSATPPLPEIKQF